MNSSLIDFFIGLTLVNIIPHYMVGILKVRFLSLYGFGDKQNMAYAYTSLAVSIILYHINYGVNTIFDHAWYAGGLFVVISYLILGSVFVKMFKE
jgi:hypothetical protein